MEESKSKKQTVFYIISIILFLIGFIPLFKNYRLIIYLAAVILSGYDLIIEGIKNIFHLNFEEDTLMTIAIIAAFIIGEYPESVAIVLLFKLGEFIEDKAIERTNKNIRGIVEVQVKTANIINENGKIEKVNADTIKKGDKILVKVGEIVPADCKIIQGETSLDTSSLTGESEPRAAYVGEEILSGSVNLSGVITCIAVRDYADSAISKIVDLVYEATNNKAKKEEYITKFSKIYTPTVIVIAVILAIIPALLGQNFETWLYRALVFLVASCPCSIVISIPLAYFSCIGAISKKGMLIKGSKHIEDLANATAIAFDKTGTITTGKMKVKKIITNKEENNRKIIEYAYALEKNSNHPISLAITRYGEENKIKKLDSTDQKEIAGLGICGKINGNEILIGNQKLLDKMNVKYDKKNIIENAIVVVKEGSVLGQIVLEEDIRKGIEKTIEDLKGLGLKKLVMLTGDNKKNAEKIAKECSNIEFKSDLLPDGKVNEVKNIKKNNKVIFVGDGINDSPVLATADFGIAMGAGTDIAGTAADSILISNNINTLPKIIQIARKTLKVVNENIFISILAKLIVLVLGIVGIAPVWLAVAADTGITLLTVLNSIRIFR